ncbi:MAG TPA: tripartite tricarboxylate transporter substrate binding protein [Thermodesulfobacteriota bacterium]|nr:tripartite tricarboxylate transporter substrate binding protein [Thermodesulfobacteriota bacterium]
MRRGEKKMRSKSLFLVILGWLVWTPAWAADDFPSKPITIVVSWSAGGGQDLVARALQPPLQEALKQSVVIVNRPGGGASIGFNSVSASDPDGYTICQASPSMNILKYTLKAGIDYKNFAPIIFGAYTPATILVKVDAPWKDLKEFLAYAKANPGKIRIANSGYGGIFHIAAIAIEKYAQVKLTHVPYKGTAPSVPALLGGHIDAILAGFGDTQHFIKDGKMKAIGVQAPERSKFAPNVQTFKELGMDVDMVSYYSWVAPKNTPRNRINVLFEGFKKALHTKSFEEFADSQGVTIAIKDPDEFGRFFEKEDVKFKELITMAGIKPEG